MLFGAPRHARRTGPFATVAATTLIAGLFSAAPASAAAADIGYRDFSWGGGSAATPTKDTTQHKAWYTADGKWWAVLFNATRAAFDIYRLNTSTQTWVDTGVVVDDRDTAHLDVLLDGSKLYVAGVTTQASSSVPKVNRLTYASGTWTVDSGFPRTVPQTGAPGAPSASIVKDGAGRLWLGWMESSSPSDTDGPFFVTVSHSTDDGVTWSTPYALAGQEAPPTGIGGAIKADIVQLVAFGSGSAASVGAFWSHEVADASSGTNNGFYFASRLDSASALDASTWSDPELALGGPYTADNHLSVSTDENGRVLAAVKTARDGDPGPNGSDPLVAVLRRVGAGSWETHTVLPVSTVGRPTRPYLLVDTNAHTADVLMTDPETAQTSTNPRTVYVKSASLSDLAFGSGLGTAVLQSATDFRLNDVTSTRQRITAASGWVILAADTTTKFYLHACAGAPCPVKPAAAFSTNPSSGVAPLAVTFTDESTGSPAAWSWTFGDGGTSTDPNPTHTYPTAGTYTVTLTVTNAAGSSTASHSVVVNSPSGQIRRDAGPNRYATAAAVATTEFTAPVESVFIATGANFPDALAGAAAAGAHDSPVLLVDSIHDVVPVPTQTALEALKPTRIVVLGGASAVSSKILDQLKSYVDDPSKVTRESGSNRYATAAAVATKEFTSPVNVAYIATGDTFPDSLAGAAAGGFHDGPVLLIDTAHNTIPTPTKNALTALHPKRIVVLGGKGSVSASIETQLGSYTSGSVTRDSGSNRYATAAAVATKEFTSPVDVAYVATGQNFPDALAGAAAAGSQGGPVLMIDSIHNTIPQATKDALEALKPHDIVILGSASTVSETIASQLAAYVP